MAPLSRRHEAQTVHDSSRYRLSAVMVMLCRNAAGELYFPLIERMSYNGVHSGQIALPGGKYEEVDGSLAQTAQRECLEEIGVQPSGIIGPLSPLHITVSGFLVHPFVGYYDGVAPILKQQEREVKSILPLKLDTFVSEQIVKEGVVEVNGNMRIKTPYFEVEGARVWGATAMILSELKQVLKTIS